MREAADAEDVGDDVYADGSGELGMNNNPKMEGAPHPFLTVVMLQVRLQSMIS